MRCAGWVRNLLTAGGGAVVRQGRTYDLRDVRLTSPDDPGVPAAARPMGRVSGVVLVGRLGEARPGFGPGPAAD